MVCSITQSRLSPFGPHHISHDGVNTNIWSFGGGTGATADVVGINKSTCCDGISNPNYSYVFNEPCSDPDSKDQWSCSAVQSTGKKRLINNDDDDDDDDGWKDLETTLNSALNRLQIQDDSSLLEASVTLDSKGQREITGEALHQELKRFSGVIRLQTFMEIFKVESFHHMVEFFSVLQTRCNMIFDPRVGTMVIFRKHVYIPARKVTFRHEEVKLLAGAEVRAIQVPSKHSSPRFLIDRPPLTSKCLSPRSPIIKPQVGSKGKISPATVSFHKLNRKEQIFDYGDIEGRDRAKFDFKKLNEKRTRIRRRRNLRLRLRTALH